MTDTMISALLLATLCNLLLFVGMVIFATKHVKYVGKELRELKGRYDKLLSEWEKLIEAAKRWRQ